MRIIRRSGAPGLRLPFILLAALMAVLWTAGGASRIDVPGQFVVRGASWLCLLIVAVAGRLSVPQRGRTVLAFLAVAMALAVIQLLPLPPAIWTMLPGRAGFPGNEVLGESLPWRPWTLAPAATFDAAGSLVVPFAVLALIAVMDERQWRRVPALMLIVIAASALLGLLQASGLTFDNPFINESIGYVGGSFANRNHFALFLAFGCLLAPVWAFLERSSRWRALAALALVLLFALVILTTGSRAGMVVGMVAVGLSLPIVWTNVRTQLARHPRWIAIALIASAIVVIALFVLISVAADRAASINRAFALDPGQDMRGRALPTVLTMIGEYFPFGAGLGSFEPLFKMHEPFALLKPTYFNHAHNDFLELALEAGLLGLAILAAALAWWLWASIRAWLQPGTEAMLPRLGGAMLLLVWIASAFDYPVRTPMMIATMVIAATWLAQRPQRQGTPALPSGA